MTSFDLQIQAATDEVRALDRALQLSYGTGQWRYIEAAKESWAIAFHRLNQLIQQRNRRAAR